MKTMQIPKQLMEISKITIDNTFKTMLAMQDHSRRIASGVVEKTAWIPAGGKKAINDWLLSYRKSIEGLKSVSDKNYQLITSLLEKKQESAN
ncbi:MAG: hypothetical protein ABRQ35_08605 [Smithellaceae bacterium]